MAQSDLARTPALGTSVPDRFPDHRRAQGRIQQFGIRPGLVASLYDVCVLEPFDGTAFAEPCLSIAAFIAASGTGVIERCGPEPSIRIPYLSDYTYISFIRGRTFGRYELVTGSRFLGVEVRASLELLERLNALQLFESASASHPLHFVSTDSFWIGRLPLARAVKAATLRLLDAGLEHRDDLSVEARSLDILTAAIALMREPLAGNTMRVTRDARKLMAAKTLMMADMARPWRIADVARQVGLSEKRLKAGFREYFGEPVHGFLQRSRLQAAKAMLGRDDASITDIALAVGYANPSHFAHLFRREFGISPSAYLASLAR